MTMNEWVKEEKGTKAYRVSTFTNEGNCVDVQYVLKDTDSTEEELEQEQDVSPSFLTETTIVRKL